ncbi:hypothetical protein PR202_ga01863 [Eleusine coracana subsp. coracana]|uniref:Folate receptor-like domain-containing protein n=1 Tax=Eleusine coracana subsp. coracana TaxID=191504 RepID=A0AAV5BHP7_ELECO|nr:hypothetical protein PR202_ga01176 [Eleusine coracana subsp. coracana]GJM86045.1 hypothetical protein PR202_ga01863 [Eleusine coracana subsp. coracana]
MGPPARPRVVNSLTVLLILVPLVFAPVAIAGQQKGVCISPGGRFPAFSSEGKPPGKAPKGRRDLALCRIFRQKTCCDVTQTFPALVSVRNLALTGEGSNECLHLWELLECSICDPRVGVRPGPPVVCASFCDMVFKACSEAYFSVDMKTQRWATEMPVGERVSWAIGGMVLTAGLIFISKRKSYSHRQKQAATVRTMRLRRLDPRANPQQPRRS